MATIQVTAGQGARASDSAQKSYSGAEHSDSGAQKSDSGAEKSGVRMFHALRLLSFQMPSWPKDRASEGLLAVARFTSIQWKLQNVGTWM